VITTNEPDTLCYKPQNPAGESSIPSSMPQPWNAIPITARNLLAPPATYQVDPQNAVRSSSISGLEAVPRIEWVKPSKQYNPRLVLPSPVSQQTVEIALNHFIQSYVPGSHFEYVPAMLTQFYSSQCMNSSIRAVALANLAREKQDGLLMSMARAAHTNAVKDISAALKSDQITWNSTLVSGLVLGLFEAIAFDEKSSLDSWIAHTNGTMGLIKFRGKQLLQTDFGRQIYIQVANNIRANCAQRHTPLPQSFLEIDREMAPQLINLHPMVSWWPVVDMVIRMACMDFGM
jgi:Fungal specific transcription factor domain